MNRKQQLRRERIAKGLCANCGKTEPKPGVKQCQKCLDYNKQVRNKKNDSKNKKKIRESRRNNKICTHCGKQPARAGFAECTSCSTMNKNRDHKKRTENERNKICVRCSKNKTYQRYKICQQCRNSERHVKTQKYIRLGLCRTCGTNPIKSGDSTLCEPCSTRLKRNKRNKVEENKRLIFEHYGNKCSCCGESEVKFLTLDHINNDGAEHKRILKSKNPAAVRSWVIKNSYPDNFQILCFNCNCAKGIYGNCPHND